MTMSRGKTIRAEFEDKLENAAYEWWDAKTSKRPDVIVLRKVFRVWATALAILIDPDDAENNVAIVKLEKEYLGRVKD